MHQDNQPSRFHWFLFAIIAFNLFWLNTEVLWDEDEGAYAGIVFNMVKTGDWLVPDFTWSMIHRKTPFHFWASAVSYKVLGINEFALRLPSVLAILTAIATLFFLTKSIIDVKTARNAALIFGASFFIPHLGKIALTDGWLLLFQTLAFLALVNQVFAPQRRWFWLLWGSVALGVLTKGPPIIITVGGAWVLSWLLLPNRRFALNALHPWFGFPLAMLPFGLWIYATIQRDGGVFAQFLLDWYVLNRVTGSVLGQTGPPGYHLGVLVVSFLPFLPLFPSALKQVVSAARQRDTLALIVSAWLAFGWLFFELMSSKLPAYSLAAQPAMAILMAQVLNRLDTEGVKKMEKITAIFWLLLGLILSVGLLVAVYVFSLKNKTLTNGLIINALPASFFLFVAPLVGTWAIYKNRVSLIFPSMMAMGAGTIFSAWFFLMPKVDGLPIKATRRVVEKAVDLGSPDAVLRICTNETGLRQPSLPFYGVSKFKDCQIEDDIEKIKSDWISGKKMVVITDSAQVERLFNWRKEAVKSVPIKTEIEFWDTDDKLASKFYFILKNE